MNMGYEAAGRKIDELLAQLEREKDNLSQKARNLKKKVDEALS